MASGDKNPIPGGSPAENVATRLDTDGDSEQGIYDVFAAADASALATVTTSNTPVQINGGASLKCKAVRFVCPPSNTGYIVIGVSNAVRALLTSSFRGITRPLYAEDEVTVAARDASLLWIDASVNGEGIVWTPLKH